MTSFLTPKLIPGFFLWLVGFLSLGNLFLGLAHNNLVLVVIAVLLTAGFAGSEVPLLIWGDAWGKLLAIVIAAITVFAVADTTWSCVEQVRVSGSEAKLAAVRSSLEYTTIKDDSERNSNTAKTLTDRIAKLPNDYSTAYKTVSADLTTATNTVAADNQKLVAMEAAVSGDKAQTQDAAGESFFAGIAKLFGSKGSTSWVEFYFSVAMGVLSEITVLTTVIKLICKNMSSKTEGSPKAGAKSEVEALAVQKVSAAPVPRLRQAKKVPTNAVAFVLPKFVLPKKDEPVAVAKVAKKKAAEDTNPQLSLFA